MNSPNILLVVLDTARAQTVLPGLRNGVVPALGRIAAEGTTFSNVTTTAPWTVPSHASLFTGQYTSDHGTHGGHRQFDPDVPSLATRLGEQEYRTTAISGNVWVSPEFGFDSGFDRFSMKWDLFWDGADLSKASTADGLRNRARGLVAELSVTNAHKTAANALYGKFLSNRYDDGAWLTTRRAIRWIRQHGASDTPWFFFINYLEPHLEYDPPSGYRETFLPPGTDPSTVSGINQDPWRYVACDVEMTDDEFDVLTGLYEGELNYVDTQIARLYDALAAAGVLDETVLIIAADHGENIGEHGMMDHQYCLYETLLHVPLVIRYPPAFDGDTVVDEVVELRDLYPTVLEFAGVDPQSLDDTVSKSSLVPNSTRSPRDRAIAEYLVPQPSMDAMNVHIGRLPPSIAKYDRALRSIRTTRWKLIEGSDGHVELYDLSQDPNETTEVSNDNPRTVERLRSRLHEDRGSLQRKTNQSDVVSDRSRQRLENLGYLQ